MSNKYKGIYTVVTKDAIAIVREILNNDSTRISASGFRYKEIMHSLYEYDVPIVLEHANFGNNVMEFYTYFYDEEVTIPLMAFAENCVYNFSVYVSPIVYLHILNERSSHE